MIMLGVLFAIMAVDELLAPIYPLMGVITLTAGTYAAWELSQLLIHMGFPVKRWFCVLGTFFVLLSNWIPHLAGSAPATLVDSTGEHFHSASPLLYPFGAFVLAGMVSLLLAAWQFDGFETPGENGMPVLRTVGMVGHGFVFFYVGVLGSFLLQSRWLGTNSREGLVAFLLIALVPKVCDIGAYFTGRMMGRHKMVPILSPGKTWEGAAGGLVLALLLAILAAKMGEYFVGRPMFHFGQLVAVGLLLAVLGQLGDLMESLIKRESRQKDASSRVPGFGGVLDVVDSILFSAPVGYWLLSGL